MDEKVVARRLGIPPGATLMNLVALAEKTSPRSPWSAFQPLWLLLPWLESDETAGQIRHGTPRNVAPFAETGGDLNHFGFLMDGILSTDERPIVYVEPKNEDDATQIVAPNLRAFLGLVSVAFAEVVSRSATDTEWFGFRKQWYDEDVALLAQMGRLSDLLCTLPGVTRPESPSKVANAYPDQAFKLVFDDEEAEPAPLPSNRLWDAHEATGFAQRALEERRYEEAVQHAKYGLQHPASMPRSMFVLATAEWHLGRKNAAQATMKELLRAWLDPKGAVLPRVHPRKVIERAEMTFLLRLVEGAQASPFIEQVESAPELEEASGDFF